MILLPDEDGLPVGAQVNALIGDALRHSVADVEPSPGFSARLAAALDAEQGGHPAGLAPAAQPATGEGGALAGLAAEGETGEAGGGQDMKALAAPS